MRWRIARGRYTAEALTEEEIHKLQAASEIAVDHIDYRCNACRCAARDQRAALQSLPSDLQHMVLAHARPPGTRRRSRSSTRRSAT
jgi:hypothetical protein